MDAHENVSLSCSNSAVLKKNSRMLHLIINAEVSKALGLQVASVDSTSSLNLLQLLGHLV
jgi:hypothetical protein